MNLATACFPLLVVNTMVYAPLGKSTTLIVFKPATTFASVTVLPSKLLIATIPLLSFSIFTVISQIGQNIRIR